VPVLPAWNLTRTLAAGFAVLFMVAFWSGEAHAGCGDHVVILSKKTSGTDDIDKTPDVPPPCSGPNCSLKQAPPTPLPSAPVYAKPLPLDALLTADAAPDHDTDRHPYPDLTSLSVSRSTDIFHPPRCSRGL